jgi:hypothetical protein
MAVSISSAAEVSAAFATYRIGSAPPKEYDVAKERCLDNHLIREVAAPEISRNLKEGKTMDRRRMLTYLGASPALLAGFPAGAETVRRESASRNGSSPASEVGGDRVTVMNPAIAGKLAARVPLAPPLADLNNKTIYMVNLSWEGPDAANYLYTAMTEWLQKRYTGVKTIQKVTAEGMFGGDPAIVREVTASKADAAIVGVAG